MYFKVICFKVVCVYNGMYARTFNRNLNYQQEYLFSFKQILFDKKDYSVSEQLSEWPNLIHKVASQGCRTSFKLIFNHYFPILVSQNIKKGLTKEVSAELAQETMVKIWNQASAFDKAKGDFSAWVYIISRNIRYDFLRKIKHESFNVAALDIYSDQILELKDSFNIEELFDVVFLKENVKHLSDEQREVIVKIYFEGMSQQELATDLKIPIGTVKSRLRLAIGKLKEKMEKKSI